MLGPTSLTVREALWRWVPTNGKGRWYFLRISGAASDEIRIMAMAGPWLNGKGGFGSVRVEVEIGESRWKTSLFPDKSSGGWLLPVKASVRSAESLESGDEVTATIRL